MAGLCFFYDLFILFLGLVHVSLKTCLVNNHFMTCSQWSVASSSKPELGTVQPQLVFIILHLATLTHVDSSSWSGVVWCAPYLERLSVWGVPGSYPVPSIMGSTDLTTAQATHTAQGCTSSTGGVGGMRDMKTGGNIILVILEYTHSQATVRHLW